MMHIASAGSAATLADINQLVRQTEQAIGAFVGLAHDAQATQLFFSSRAPSAPTVIAAWAPGAPASTDESFVDSGDIYVAGALTFCIATR